LVFPGRIDTQFVNRMIKTGPEKVVLLSGVAAKRKQVIKTKPEKTVYPSGVNRKT
jgi:hypothetical protein